MVGFGYEFNALDDTTNNPLIRAYADMFQVDDSGSILTILEGWVPFIALLPGSRARRVIHNQKIIRVIVDELIETRRKDSAMIEQGKDVLSVLLREQGKDADLIPTSELRDQCLTFLAAGHETTSSGISWALHLLRYDGFMHVLCVDDGLV